jgi:hypothetical protein
MAFNVIAQGPFYKKKHLPDKFWEQFLSSSYVLSVGIIFLLHSQQPRNAKKKVGTDQTIGCIQVVQAPRHLQSRL